MDQDGAITNVSCLPTGEHYRHGDVFVCVIRHVSDAEYEWCVATVRDKLVTQFEDPSIACTGYPEAAGGSKGVIFRKQGSQPVRDRSAP